MRKTLLTVVAVAAVAVLAVALFRDGVWAPSDTPAVPAAGLARPPTLEAAPSPRSALSFTALEQPRLLPEVRFVDGDGRALTLADFRGRMVLLNLWATWCAPCIREMPTLDRLQAELGGPGFEVIVLSIDVGGLPAVKDFYRRLGLKALGIYADRTARATRALGITGIPTTLLVDRKGREVGRVAGPAEWDSPDAVKLIRRHLEQPSGAGTGSDGPRETAPHPG